MSIVKRINKGEKRDKTNKCVRRKDKSPELLDDVAQVLNKDEVK